MFKTVKLILTVLIFISITTGIPLIAEEIDFLPNLQISENKSVGFRNYGVFAPVSFSLYAIGLYVDGVEKDNMKLKNADQPMAIQLVSLYRRLKMKTLISELRRGFSYGMNHDKEFLKTIQERIDDFIYLLEKTGKNPRKYYRITFLYVPNEGTHVSFQGNYLGTIPGLDFKKALFGIWLNNNCANDELRDSMIKIKLKK